ncbi:MAG: chemotaxis protein [Clostridiaceae bacterium]|uniref:Chemotaxis protein n=1 Tax=Clostridium porci TaxID=2605778 RepID=A0A7X2TCK1_9CLOT|nr:chemotaxis protein [Clostridium porci]MDY3230575.1 chemotaxis protein [Clostridiaceae bacterium]MSS36625.1 chemotaxis protein [Clostridium porci]
MTKGNPNPQTVATNKYQKKAGYMTKGFKLKREVVEQFEDACRKTGVSQASQITEMMKKFIEEQNKQ